VAALIGSRSKRRKRQPAPTSARRSLSTVSTSPPAADQITRPAVLTPTRHSLTGRMSRREPRLAHHPRQHFNLRRLSGDALSDQRRVIAAAVPSRWLAMGLRTAADAAGQLIFLPLLEMFAQRYGWWGVCVAVTQAVFTCCRSWRFCCRNGRRKSKASPPTVLRRRAAKRLRAR